MTQHQFLDHLHFADKIFGHDGLLHQFNASPVIDADGDEDAVYLSPLALGLAALLLLINGLLSVYLSLGLHKTLGIAAVRQAILCTACADAHVCTAFHAKYCNAGISVASQAT